MAQLLIKAVNAVHTDPVKDERGCYKRGDVVGVAPNNWEWGAKELIPPAQGGKFVIINITDVTRQQVINWVRNHWNCAIDGADTTDFITVRRRRVHIDWTALPVGVRNTLNTTGQYVTTWAQIRQFIRNKLNAQTAADSPIE